MSLDTETKKIVQRGVDHLATFSVAGMTGRRVGKGEKVELGQLPRREAHGLERAVYVVCSSQTPIAWSLGKDTWIIPKVNYSDITSQHQSLVKAVVDNPGLFV